KLTSGDRVLWICLSHPWRDWRSTLAIVKPETVIAWHPTSPNSMLVLQGLPTAQCHGVRILSRNAETKCSPTHGGSPRRIPKRSTASRERHDSHAIAPQSYLARAKLSRHGWPGVR